MALPYLLIFIDKFNTFAYDTCIISSAISFFSTSSQPLSSKRSNTEAPKVTSSLIKLKTFPHIPSTTQNESIDSLIQYPKQSFPHLSSPQIPLSTPLPPLKRRLHITQPRPKSMSITKRPLISKIPFSITNTTSPNHIRCPINPLPLPLHLPTISPLPRLPTLCRTLTHHLLNPPELPHIPLCERALDIIIFGATFSGAVTGGFLVAAACVDYDEEEGEGED